MCSVALTDGYRMSGKGVAVQSPNLVFSLAVLHDLHILAHGFLGRSKAQALLATASTPAALLGEDGNVGCKSWFQFQISIWSGNHYLVVTTLLVVCSFQTHLLHRSFEGIIRISIYGKVTRSPSFTPPISASSTLATTCILVRSLAMVKSSGVLKLAATV